jgi:hypothetical protein
VEVQVKVKPKGYWSDETPSAIATHQDGSSDTTVDRHAPQKIATHHAEAGTLTERESQNSKINKNYLEFIDSLSEDERENFLEFGRKKAANLPHPPELPDKWIAANFTELYKQFLASRAGQEAKQEAIARKYDWENDPRFMDWLHKAYCEGYPWTQEDEAEREQRTAFLFWAQRTNAYAGRIEHESA